MHKVIISTVGLGSRLESLTKYKNKSLVALNNQPVISHQINFFEPDTEFVVALGYKGSLVREYLELAHPNRNITFHEVSPFAGEGSSLGFTLISCKQYLQEPFIFLSCDTIVTEPIPKPDFNWVGYCKHSNPSNQYRTVNIIEHKIDKILEKDEKIFCDSKNYIGLCGIYDYKLFWEAYSSCDPKLLLQGESVGLRALLDARQIEGIPFTWFDTGNLHSLDASRKSFSQQDSPNILVKEDEDIWFVNESVIKFFSNSKIVRDRVLRAGQLDGFVPPIVSAKNNMYLYHKLTGKVVSDCIDIELFRKLLDFSSYFWQPINNIQGHSEIREYCYQFYKHKTLARVQQFQKRYAGFDGEITVNGINLPSTIDQLNLLNWHELCDGIPVRFHGDYHFENILYNNADGKFMLLDWRQDFAGNLSWGDIYYDLAKLLHGLIVNHDYVANDLYSVNNKGSNSYMIDIRQRLIYFDCINELKLWCSKNNLSFTRVQIICALIFLNISPLHHQPYANFLHLLGKKMLSEVKP